MLEDLEFVQLNFKGSWKKYYILRKKSGLLFFLIM